LVLRPQFFKSLRPSKIKTKTKNNTALAKTKTSKKGLKTGLKSKTGINDYITADDHSKENTSKILESLGSK